MDHFVFKFFLPQYSLLGSQWHVCWTFWYSSIGSWNTILLFFFFFFNSFSAENLCLLWFQVLAYLCFVFLYLIKCNYNCCCKVFDYFNNRGFVWLILTSRSPWAWQLLINFDYLVIKTWFLLVLAACATITVQPEASAEVWGWRNLYPCFSKFWLLICFFFFFF